MNGNLTKIIGALIGASIFLAVGVGMAHASTVFPADMEKSAASASASTTQCAHSRFGCSIR
jgi:hypothetical protein